MATSHVDISVSSRYGELFRSFWEGDVPANTAYDFIIVPPAGLKLIGIARNQTVFDGRLDVTFMVGGTGYTVAEELTGYNFNEITGTDPLAVLERVTGLTGAAARTSSAPIISPSTGPVRTPSVQTSLLAQPVFDSTNFPVFRYFNPDVTNPVSLWLDVIWQEEEVL